MSERHFIISHDRGNGLLQLMKASFRPGPDGYVLGEAREICGGRLAENAMAAMQGFRVDTEESIGGHAEKLQALLTDRLVHPGLTGDLKFTVAAA